MENYLVVESERRGNLIVHKVDNGGMSPDVYRWSAIRAGLSWPTATAEGFYIILGEEYLEEFRFEGGRRGKLKVFAEKDCQSLFLDGLFKSLTDDCALYHCDKIYTGLTTDTSNEGASKEAEFFREFAYSNHIRFGALEEAPYHENFALGVSIIKRWEGNGLLVLPEDSLVRKELKTLTKEDLADNPEARYPAVNALRFAVAAFEKFNSSGFGAYRPPRCIK